MPDNKHTRKAVADALGKLQWCKIKGFDQTKARQALKEAQAEYDRKENNV